MARITVEDCIEQVPNRFELVLIATKRARQIWRGAAPMVDEDKDKPTVLALREIAAGHVDASILDETPEERLDTLAASETAREEGAEVIVTCELVRRSGQLGLKMELIDSETETPVTAVSAAHFDEDGVVYSVDEAA